MSKLADYTVVTGFSVADVVMLVKDAMQSGWEPTGGFSMLRESDKTVCYQAMVKRVTPTGGTWGR